MKRKNRKTSTLQVKTENEIHIKQSQIDMG